MKFRTEIEIRPFAPEAQFGYENRILAIGSCFATEMTARLHRLRFRCTTNPTGVLFNPASVAEALRTFAASASVTPEELGQTGDLWHHFGFHGSFSGISPETTLARMNAALHAGTEALRTADRMILTFGTAWVYEHDGQIVANCHRRRATEFVRRRLSVAEIVTEYAGLLTGPLSEKQIILTVSPVRHLGDGLEGNAASKAVLRLAAEELAERHPNIRYFPAFEILTDDLRDYRFYGADLVHPSPQAAEYVWEKFSASALTAAARETAFAVTGIVTAAAHKPQNPDTEAFRDFCRRQIALIDTLPQVDLQEERTFFANFLR